jgi:hypothetical protein
VSAPRELPACVRSTLDALRSLLGAPVVPDERVPDERATDERPMDDRPMDDQSGPG